uniref:Helicase POLQ-like n=1 Tax=Photinus pyralis TaxID=7054 RepID=A0A1Y1LMT2_PHOPY
MNYRNVNIGPSFQKESFDINDTLVQLINIDEIEQNIDTFENVSSKKAQPQNSFKTRKSPKRNGRDVNQRNDRAKTDNTDSEIDLSFLIKDAKSSSNGCYYDSQTNDDFSQFCASTQVVRQIDEIVDNVSANTGDRDMQSKRKSLDDDFKTVGQSMKRQHHVFKESKEISKDNLQPQIRKFQAPTNVKATSKSLSTRKLSNTTLASQRGASQTSDQLPLFHFLLEENHPPNTQKPTDLTWLTSHTSDPIKSIQSTQTEAFSTGKSIFPEPSLNKKNSEEHTNNMQADEGYDNVEADLNKDIEERMTQLLKSDQYRKEVSQLFTRLEHSICQFGAKESQTKNDWLQDSFMNETILSKITGECGETISDIIKKALKENLDKSLVTKKLVNTTLTTSPIVFKEMGKFYGLPNIVEDLIKKYKGIENLYEWQHECLSLPAVKKRKNLIYSLPTSGGKTLVAEILILREILCRKQNVIFVLPYVSIVQEKVWALSPFGVALDFLVEEYAAGKGVYPPRKRRYKNSVYIATTEKALGLINSLIETGRLGELGLIVIDELHLIGEEQRGPTLEALLTKLMYIAVDIHIVGMSATIGNLSELSQFLNADVYTRNFRPVELIEYVKCGQKIAKVNPNADKDQVFEPSRESDFGYSERQNKIDPDHLGALVMEVIPTGSCLIFCPTKKNAENVTKLLCDVVSRKLTEHKVLEKNRLFKALKNDATICNILQKSIPYGIAYHHSGLTTEERRLIEEAYRAGVVTVICCTSTLAAGVNLPAKRVIIRKPYIAQDFISLSRYKQMIGRAGRAGLGEVGESILICKSIEIAKVQELFLSPMDKTLSKLHESECSPLRQLFLSCIALGTANTKTQLETVISKTLLFVQQTQLNVFVEGLVKKVIHDLHKLQAVEIGDKNSLPLNDITFACTYFSPSMNVSEPVKKKLLIDNNTKLVVSKLGNAAMKGNLSLTDARLLYNDLTKAKDCLVLINCLHLLYLVTPYNLVDLIKPEKTQFHHILSKLKIQEKKTADVLGITDSCIFRMLSNRPIKTVSEAVLHRFYMSLMLYELWNETSVLDVSEKYQVNRGIVQNLMTNAATFSSNVVNFCEQLDELWAFVFLLKGMSQRLSHCCGRDILPLMELPAVKQGRAKQLYNAGFKTLQSIAKADPESLVNSIEFMSYKVANELIAAAKMLLLEKVENLREDAEDVLDGVEISAK